MAIQASGGGYFTIPATNMPSVKTAKTISFWANVTAFSTAIQTFVNFTTSTNSRGYQIGSYGNSKIRVWDFGGGAMIETATVPANATWFHLLYTFNGNSTHTVYIDNVPTVGTYTTTNATVIDVAFFGNQWGENLIGYMEDIRVYNRVLTVNEIQTIYTLRGNDGIHYGLVGQWLCTEGYSGQAATMLTDSSPFSSSNNSTTATGLPLYDTINIRGSRKIFGNR